MAISAMLKFLTYYAFNYAADSQLITSSTVTVSGLHYHKYYVHNAHKYAAPACLGSLTVILTEYNAFRARFE